MYFFLGADVAEILTVPSQARTFKQNVPVGTNYDNAQQKHGHAPAYLSGIDMASVQKYQLHLCLLPWLPKVNA